MPRAEKLSLKEQLLRDGLMHRQLEFSSWFFHVGWHEDIWKSILDCVQNGPGFKDECGHTWRIEHVHRAIAAYEAAILVGGYYNAQKGFTYLHPNDRIAPYLQRLRLRGKSKPKHGK